MQNDNSRNMEVMLRQTDGWRGSVNRRGQYINAMKKTCQWHYEMMIWKSCRTSRDQAIASSAMYMI